MIPVADLTPHPDNVREDLDLNPGFIASLAEGVLVPLLIIPRDEGGYWITDGTRRYEGAVKAGLTEVPCILDIRAAADPAGKYLTMVTTARQRKQLKPLEIATALFGARQYGASAARIRKTTGLDAKEVKAALAAAGMPGQARTRAAATERDLTLFELAAFAEFADDPHALERLADAVCRDRVEHTAELIRAERAEHAERERLREELCAAGVAVTSELPAGAAYLYRLRDDESDLTPQSHASCPGHAAVLHTYRREPEYYCTDPLANGHTSRWEQTVPAGHSSTPAASEPAADETLQPGYVRRRRSRDNPQAIAPHPHPQAVRASLQPPRPVASTRHRRPVQSHHNEGPASADAPSSRHS
jgi:ParB-like chromosome segregation protein Spo0J